MRNISQRLIGLLGYPSLLLGIIQIPASNAQPLDLPAYVSVVKILSPLTTDPLVLQQPGKLVDPLYDHSNPDHQYAAASQRNAMLLPSLIHSAAPRDLGDTYADVLAAEEWAKVPLVPAQVEDLKKLRGSLFKS